MRVTSTSPAASPSRAQADGRGRSASSFQSRQVTDALALDQRRARRAARAPSIPGCQASARSWGEAPSQGGDELVADGGEIDGVRRQQPLADRAAQAGEDQDRLRP